MQKDTPKTGRLHWEVVLFLALYIISPSYFALEFSNSIPLITFSRILLVLMGIMLLIRRRELFLPSRFCLKSFNFGLTQDRLLRWGLFLYWAILLLVNLTFLFDTSEAVKQIFVIIAEEYALVWMLCLILDSRPKLISAVKVLVIASAVNALIATIGCVIDYNPFHLLDTVSRKVTQATYYRMGILRAAGGFGHPVYYGAFCCVMLPLCMYLVEAASTKRQQLLYKGCTALNLAGVLLSNSRGSQLALVCTAFVIFLLHCRTRSLKQLFARYLPVIAVALVIVLLVVALSPIGIAYIRSTVEYLTQVADSDPGDINSGDESEEIFDPPQVSYGENANGFASRTVQLTGITYTLQQSPLFGMGPNAFARHLVAYTFIEGRLSFLSTVDVNLVAIIGQFGLVGLLAFLAQFISVGVSTIRKKYRIDPLMQALFLSFGCFMVCLLTISSLDKWNWVFVSLVVSLVNILRKEAAQATDP